MKGDPLLVPRLSAFAPGFLSSRLCWGAWSGLPEGRERQRVVVMKDPTLLVLVFVLEMAQLHPPLAATQVAATQVAATQVAATQVAVVRCLGTGCGCGLR